MAKKKKKNKNVGTVDFITGKYTSNAGVAAIDRRNNNVGTMDYTTGRYTPTQAPAPKPKVTTQNEQKRSWFNKGLFEDGYDFGDITKSLLATDADLVKNFITGAAKVGEGAIDAGAYAVQGIAKRVGNDSLAKQTKDFISQDLVEKYKLDDKLQQSISKLPVIGQGLQAVGAANAVVNGDKTQKRSVLDDKSDSLVQSAGLLAGTAGLQAVGVPWWVTMGTSSFGSGVEEAYKDGATYGEAGVYGGINAASETLLEKLSGGIKFGGMKTLDSGLKKKIATGITNKVVSTLGKFGMDMAGEGTEEVLQEVVQNVGKKLTYEDGKTWNELLTSEEAMDGYLESFIGGAVLGGGFNAKRLGSSLKTGRDYDTGLTSNEQAVVTKEVENRSKEKQKAVALNTEVEKAIKEAEARTQGTVNEEGRELIKKQVQEKLDNGEIDYSTATLSKKEITAIEKEVTNDLKKGYIGINTIEETFSTEATEKLQKLEDELTKETDPTKQGLIQKDINELRQERASELSGMLNKDVYLQESYRQENLSREAFTREETKEDTDVTKALAESAKAAGLSNTRKAHETFDLIDKIANDTGVQYGFTSNKQLKEMQSLKQIPEDIDVTSVNGFYRVTGKDGNGKILINIDSQKAIDTVIGHETTHLFEGTKEYKELQAIATDYAKTKGEYEVRYGAISKLYSGVKGANVENEITADLVGDYLFSNEQFVNELSAKQPNIFKRIYEYISGAAKKATAGSKEERQLLEFKQKYKKLYREISKATTKETETNSLTEADSNTPENVNFSMGENPLLYDSEGRKLSEGQQKYFKDSKVRNDEGNLLVMYHGTPSGNFTVFRDGSYFTPDAEYAERFQDTSASSISAGKTKDNPKTYEVYLNIKKPFDINDPEARAIYINDYIKGGNAMGINPYENDSYYDSIENIDWTEGEDLRDFLIEEGYDYDGLVLDEGADGGYGEAVQYRGKSYVTFSPEQVKDVTNLNPTDSEDIRFSLRNKNIDINTRIKYTEDVDSKGNSTYIKVNYGDYKTLSLLQGKVKGLERKTYENAASGYKADINGDTIRKIIYPTPYFNEFARNYVEKLNAAKHLPKLFESAVYVDSLQPGKEKNKGKQIKEYHYFVAPIRMNGKNYRALITAREKQNSNILYVVNTEVMQIKNGAGFSAGQKPPNVPDLPFDISVTDLVKGVKTHDYRTNQDRFYNANDIKFSLSAAIEETKDLIAIHNLSVSKLSQTLELGGMPMPSIAITKAKQGHSDFGEVSLVLNKEAIDPKASEANEVYSGDAYTPTFPSVNYEVNSKAEDRINKRVTELSKDAPEDVKKTLRKYAYGQMEDQINRWGGEQGLIESLMNDQSMKQVYLNERGQYVDTIIKKTETKLSDAQIKEYDTLISELGEDVVEAIKAPDVRRASEHRKEYFKEHGDAIKAAYGKFLKDDIPGITDEEVNDVISSMRTMGLLREVAAARKYIVNGTTTYKEEPDYNATREEVNRRVDEAAYKKWLTDLFNGVEETKGIRNDKDTFTPSGNRRSFSALHYEYNLENIVKAMKKEEAQGQAAFGTGNIRGAAAEKLGSIAEIRQRAKLLQAMPEEGFAAAKKDFDDRFMELAASLAKHDAGFTDASALLAEAVAKNKTKSGMARYIQREGEGWTNYSDYIVDDLVDLVEDIRKMPTTYFEAKPRRAVSFNEIYTALVPDNIPAELSDKLSEYGISTVKYEAGNNEDRLAKLNSMNDAMFSLGEPVAPYGRIQSRDIKLQDAINEKLDNINTEVDKTAPVRDTAPVKPERKPYETGRALTEEDIPFIEQSNAEAFDSLPVNGMDYDSIQLRIEQIKAEIGDMAENLKTDSKTGVSYDARTGEPIDIDRFMEEYNNKDNELEHLQDMMSDVDARETAATENQYADVESPLENEGRDMENVGSRKVKAYMYENPEVKPFFQEEAGYMLTELKESVKGEKFYNDQLYYDSNGEQGFFGTKRQTSSEIAYLLDQHKYTYADIEKGLNAIIEDHGAENIAVAKRIEFFLDERLREGHTDSLYGDEIPPNQEYIDLLREKEIMQYTDEAFNNYDWKGLYNTLTPEVAPEDIAPVRPMTEGSVDYITNLMREKGVDEADILEQYGIDSLQDMTQPQFMEAVDNLNADILPVKKEKPVRSNVRAEDAPTTGVQQRFNTKTGQIEDVQEPIATRTRKELRKALIENDKGFMIRAMDNAKNRSMALLNNTDTIRVTELVFGREAAKKINKLIFQEEIDNEARSIAWQNKQRKIIRELGIKPRSKMSAAVQKFGEKQYVNEYDEVVPYTEVTLKTEFPDIGDQAKIRKAAFVIRELYDSYIDRANVVLTDLGFEPIHKRDDYMRHFSELTDVFSRYGIPFNPKNMEEHRLPTDINGITDTFSPQKNYFASMQPRKGIKTNYDAITGIDGYIGGIANLIWHTEDIQRGRALEELIRETYGQEQGIENAKEIENLTEQELFDRIGKVNENHLSNYAAWVHEWTNTVAGKKNKVDRSIESMFGRKAFSFIDEIRKQVGSNMIGLNLSSSLTNLIAPVQALSKTGKVAFAKGTVDTFRNIFSNDGFVDRNAFLTARFGTDMVSKTAWDKARDVAYIFMKGVDYFSANQIVRGKYHELRAKGMSDKEAHAEAGKFAARIMGDRTKGANAQFFDSKLIGLVTQFQLEVNNQVYAMFYDTYHESKEQAKGSAIKTAAGMTFTLGQLFAFTHLFGKAFESVAGYNPTFDVIGIIATALGFGDDDDDKTQGERIEAAAEELAKALPYASILTGGGRIPIASALPVKQLFSGKDDYGNDKSRLETIKETLPYYLLPGGYGQIKKTTQGLGMFDKDNPVPGSYTDSGNLRFPVEKTPLNMARAAVFGQWSGEAARDYFDNERLPLKEKQIQEYKELDIPIKEYWDIREGLKSRKDLEGKFEYVDSLDLPLKKKNVLINNVVDRKEKVNMKDYDTYGSLKEFDFATKYPKKYKFLQNNGVSWNEYNASEESREAYNWAYKNRKGYAIAKAVTGDVIAYRTITKELNDIKADKDSSGKTIANSRKAKVIDYLNNSNLNYESKLILFKKEYNSDDEHNNEIIEYLNNREDISYKQMERILTEIGFTVESDGTVRW